MSELLELELQVLISHCISACNSASVIWKSSWGSYHTKLYLQPLLLNSYSTLYPSNLSAVAEHLDLEVIHCNSYSGEKESRVMVWGC